MGIMLFMKVTFAAGASGRSYFEKFIKDLSAQDRAVILAVFQDIQSHGLDAKGCELRQIEGKLWEVKVKAPTGGYRFFYILIASDHMHVLHSYKKQGQKAPTRELEVARKRLKEVLDEN
jgi:phage-related protein